MCPRACTHVYSYKFLITMAEENKGRERDIIERETDRQTDRQTDRPTYKCIDRLTEREKRMKRQKQTETHRKRGEGDTVTERHRHRQRQTDRTNERLKKKKNFFNDGNGISTVLFFHPALGQNNNKNNRKQNNYKLKKSY